MASKRSGTRWTLSVAKTERHETHTEEVDWGTKGFLAMTSR